MAFFAPAERLLNLSNMFPTNSTIGVTASKNALPTGTRAIFKSSTLFLNLFIEESAVIPNSFSDNDERSDTDEFAKSRTRAA